MFIICDERICPVCDNIMYYRCVVPLKRSNQNVFVDKNGKSETKGCTLKHPITSNCNKITIPVVCQVCHTPHSYDYDYNGKRSDLA